MPVFRCPETLGRNLRYIYCDMRYFLIKIILTTVLLSTLSACSSIAYYGQSIHGHFQIMNNSRDIEKILIEENTNPDTREKLTRVLQLLQFAKDNLKLPDNGSYRDYSDIGRPYVVWNVFATPEFSLEPVKSCFLFVGCLNYRGYFSEQTARQYADKLEAQTLDVFLGGVAAYSTLGWFKDPVLNTMLKWDEPYLSKLIFHELAHQKLYIKGDSAFNEAFSDTVASIGLKRWLLYRNEETVLQKEEEKQHYENEFVGLILGYKSKLEKLYQSASANELKRQQKKQLMSRLEKDYRTIQAGWKGYTGYDSWFKQAPNNAKISAISTYREFIPGFLNIYNQANNDMEEFYSRVTALSRCKPDERKRILNSRLATWSC